MYLLVWLKCSKTWQCNVESLPSNRNTLCYLLGIQIIPSLWKTVWKFLYEAKYSLTISCSGIPWWLRWLRVCLQFGRPGLIPGLGKSPGEWNSNTFQYSCMENTMDRGTWPATIHGVAESDTAVQLTHTHTHTHTHIM